ncbi:ATP-binding protein [Phocaeicola barnesiae]|uniref:ATP-binding protein n=1 Tax=Phocaeicola barnesiae TaxID=376804 RepID=UPI0025A36C98|nr:ATP-binding protein [Phocaeicola barnesiae]MDM8234543.1 ATP-binding protein [Phocaeicola barnesiae]
MNRLYPVGIQNFEKIRKDGYIYVDKTALLYQLVKTGQYYFLSRPRRFGKSLMISTLEAYFIGKRELFKGLDMERLEKDWTVYPVLHMDLNTRNYFDYESLVGILSQNLEEWEKLYGDEKKDRVPEERFMYVIKRACEKTGHKVVILIDEYDKPILQTISKPELQTEYRNTLKAFYGALKSCDGYIRFAMLTGVTKFSKVSVFSDLNNPMDISMDRRYAELCGISDAELHKYFEEDIHALADELGTDYAHTCELLKVNYDGYHFCYKSTGMYNPFSLLNTFAKRQIGSYWFETGTPTYLVELMKLHHYNVEEIEHIVTSGPVLDSIDAASTDPVPVIYQSGYLTIKDYNAEFENYTLGFPNREVEQGFFRFLLPHYASVSTSKSPYEIQRFVGEVRQGDVDGFLDRLRTFFDDTPYELARYREVHYQNILYIVFKLMGFHTEVEYRTARGRVDLVLKTADYIYVMEFKLEGTAEEAMRQIEEKGYAAPFAADGRKVIKVGVNFSEETRSIDKWIIKM